MNRYRHQFTVQCPENGQNILYFLTMDHPEVVMVEQIMAAANRSKMCVKPYHENVADYLYDQLGGAQYIRAHHHGVTIETFRGVKQLPALV